MTTEQGATRRAVAPETAFRRAMMAANPDYFSSDQATQERYRLGMSDEIRFRVEQVVIQTLFSLNAKTQDELHALLEQFDDPQSLRFNSAMLFARGIGDDLFFLNEYLEEDKTLADFQTLADYDYDDHCFQEKARSEQFSDYEVQPYLGALHGTWARLQINQQFFYASLWMAAQQIGSTIHDWGLDKIEERIPHDYVRGKDDGKREAGGTLLDLRVDANGQEAQLEELQRRYYRYIDERERAIANTLDREQRGCVYLFQEHWDSDPHMRFVFTDKTALQGVRFRHFMADCRKITGDRNALSILEEEEKHAALAFIDHQFRDIQDNFDPTIVQFRKKKKIILADGALDGLL